MSLSDVAARMGRMSLAAESGYTAEEVEAVLAVRDALLECHGNSPSSGTDAQVRGGVRVRCEHLSLRTPGPDPGASAAAAGDVCVHGR